MPRVTEVFQRSGLNQHQIFTFGLWSLHVFSTQIQKGENLKIASTATTQSYLFGTLLYKRRMGKAALHLVHQELLSDQLDISLLKGNFAIIIWDGKCLKILQDRLGCYQIFQRYDGYCLSSSFLALLVSSGHRFRINKDALAEKLATGFLTGTETLVEGLVRIDNGLYYTVESKHLEYRKHPEFETDVVPHKNGRRKSITAQLDILEEYFGDVNAAQQGKQGDIGLSSGFDCRLILAASKHSLDEPLHIHSHSTGIVHDVEIKYAKQIAAIYGTNVHVVPTAKLETSGDVTIERVLLENVYFFDGRSARHLGAFSETYTFAYRQASKGDAAFSLNGLGGEIYRDSYFMGWRNMTWDDWAKRFLFFPISEYAVGGGGRLKQVAERLKLKLEAKLHLNFDQADLFKTHAHYGLIKMPQCNGAVAHAYGKVSEFLFPFIEYNQVIEALKAVHYLGIGGTYQAQMITHLAPDIASVGSHYGFSFEKLPMKYLLWSLIKSVGPSHMRETLVKDKIVKQVLGPETQEFLRIVDTSPYLSSVKSTLIGRCPEIEFDILMTNNKYRRIGLFLGAFFLEFADYIE